LACWRSRESRSITCAFAAFPFAKGVEAFLNQHEFNFIVEQNRDGQLSSLLTLETGVKKEKLRSILLYGGFPLSASQVVDAIHASIGESYFAIDSETYSDAPEFTTE
jgi:acid phosphatase family membrane protein YuiD